MNKQVTVIQVVSSPEAGGAELLVRELAASVKSYGVKSKALYFCNFPEGNKKKFKDNEFCLNLKKPRSIRAIFKLRSFFKKEKMGGDKILVHGHLTWPLFFLPIALFGLGIPMVYTQHDTYNRRRNYPILKNLESFFYKKFNAIYCISEGVKQSLDEWLKYKARTKVIYNGARKYNYSLRSIPKDKKINIISVGSLNKNKGFDFALKVIDQIRGRVNQYMILGEGPERKNLESQIKELGLAEIVKLIGWVDDLQPYFNDSHLQIIPSRYEGFGLVAAEGMSSGLLVIASNVDGLSEVVCKNNKFEALLPLSVKKWINALDVVSSLTEEEYHELSLLYFNFSRKFSLKKMTTQYCSQYKNIIESDV